MKSKYLILKEEAFEDLKESFKEDFKDESFQWDALAYGLVQEGSPLADVFSAETLTKAKVFFKAEDILMLVDEGLEKDELEKNVLINNEDDDLEVNFEDFETEEKE